MDTISLIHISYTRGLDLRGLGVSYVVGGSLVFGLIKPRSEVISRRAPILSASD